MNALVFIAGNVLIALFFLKTRTALHHAVYHSQELVGFLLDAGAGIDVRDEDSMTPMLRAAKAAMWDMVRYLLTRGADINALVNVSVSL